MVWATLAVFVLRVLYIQLWHPYGLAPDEAPWCARVIVALSADGRAYLDGFSRAAELTAVFFHWARSLADLQRSYGTDVVALPAPDAAPPVGKVGYFDDGHTRAVAAVLTLF